MIVLLYISAIVVANLTVFYAGPWFSPINSFFLIGLDLSLRDKLHDRWKNNNLWPRMLGMISAASLISWILNPASRWIAFASVCAFAVASMADALAYNWLISRRFIIRSNGSNIAGALSDSIIFPTLAFGVVMPEIIAMQFFAKVAGGFIWSIGIHRMWQSKHDAVEVEPA
jgi:uncharacterized PurR-regulated membrane protein YhhQ (DUF165 family)